MKKKLFILSLCAVFVLSFAGMAYAKTAKKGVYTISYDLYSATVNGKSGAGASTAENSGKGAEVYATVSMFSYKNGTVKNSASKTQVAYVKTAIAGKGGKTFTSYHNLLRDNYRPIGNSLSLTR